MNCLVRPAALLIAALLAPAALCADDYSAPALALARAAAGAGLKSVAVLGLDTRGVPEDEADYAAGRLTAGLSAAGGVEVRERALLGRILGERRLAASAGPGGEEGLDRLFSAQAAVSGTVYPDADGLRIALRLVEVATGRVVAAAELRSARAFAAGEWRDAVAEAPAGCAARRAELDRLNAGAADAKARYWAARLKEPGFTYSSLTRNLGAELRDPAVRAEFFRLLLKYGRPGVHAGLSADDLRLLGRLLPAEELYYDDCGL